MEFVGTIVCYEVVMIEPRATHHHDIRKGISEMVSEVSHAKIRKESE